MIQLMKIGYSFLITFQWPKARSLQFKNESPSNMKITIHISNKNDEGIGVAELALTKENFNKRDKNIKKWVAVNNEVQRKSIIQTQSAKFAHTVTQMMKMLLKVTIDYDSNKFVEPSPTMDVKGLVETNQTDANLILSNLNNMKRGTLSPPRASMVEKRGSVAAQLFKEMTANTETNEEYEIEKPDKFAKPEKPEKKEAKGKNQNINSNHSNHTPQNKDINLTHHNDSKMKLNTVEKHEKSDFYNSKLMIEDSPKKEVKPISKSSPKKITDNNNKNNKNKPITQGIIHFLYCIENKHKGKQEEYDKYRKNLNEKIFQKGGHNNPQPLPVYY